MSETEDDFLPAPAGGPSPDSASFGSRIEAAVAASQSASETAETDTQEPQDKPRKRKRREKTPAEPVDLAPYETLARMVATAFDSVCRATDTPELSEGERSMWGEVAPKYFADKIPELNVDMQMYVCLSAIALPRVAIVAKRFADKRKEASP